MILYASFVIYLLLDASVLIVEVLCFFVSQVYKMSLGEMKICTGSL